MSLLSSMMAARAVLKWKRLPMSTVAFCTTWLALISRARSAGVSSSAPGYRGSALLRRSLGDAHAQQSLVERVGHLPPHPAQEAVDTLDALVVSTPRRSPRDR